MQRIKIQLCVKQLGELKVFWYLYEEDFKTNRFKSVRNNDCDATDCCCWQIFYFQLDFVNIPSVFEKLCKHCRCQVLFLLKFHCELNFIEQCWGYAKRKYREFPPSSREADLERNIIEALDSVPLVSMHQWVNVMLQVACMRVFALPLATSYCLHCMWFMDAYCKGLNSSQALSSPTNAPSCSVLQSSNYLSLSFMGYMSIPCHRPDQICGWSLHVLIESTSAVETSTYDSGNRRRRQE